ncbi:MAG: DNA-binding protein WhiA [Clostridia bacterium]|nr:DNA-binding protein WhiA [Clostridia bacterium]MBR4444102.1 DNA-binding protein WhiA [Clostridia bacterium]
MSFSTDAKSEIMRQPYKDRRDVRAELTAFALLAGSVSFRGSGRYLLSTSSENAAVMRYAFTQARRVAQVTPEIQTVRSNQLGDHVRYRLALTEEDSLALLNGLDLLDPNAFLGIRREPPKAVLAREGSRVAFVRGAFLAVGWVNHPEKAYHLEFAMPDAGHAEGLMRMLAKMGFRCGVAERKSQFVAYIKDADGVSRLLAMMGAFGAYMAFENVRIMKQLRGGVNRQMNCDDSNTDKTVRAAEKQLNDIEYLRAHGGLEALPRPLREIAEARYNNPDANLAELGQLLDPPIGKSGVNNRLRRLSALADEKRGL